MGLLMDLLKELLREFSTTDSQKCVQNENAFYETFSFYNNFRAIRFAKRRVSPKVGDVGRFSELRLVGIDCFWLKKI